MSNESTSESLPPEERARLRRLLSEQAVKLVTSNRWDDAVVANREILRLFGDDSQTYNRLGKALSEVGQITEARSAYARSIELDPTNTIARRNLDRLASQKDSVAASATPSQLDTRLFVEESGKASVATLQAVDADRVKLLDPGDLVALEAQGNAVNVVTQAGEYIGMVEPRVGLRLSRLMAGGNKYSAALVTSTGAIRVMLRETFQHASQVHRVSFPQARATEVRAYTRKGLLRGEEMDFSEDDDEPEDEPEEWSETGEDIERAPVGVDIDGDEDSFD